MVGSTVLIPLLKQELREVEKSIKNMLDAIQNGIFTPSTKERLEELETRKEDSKISIAQEQMFKPMLNPKEIKFFFNKLRKLDTTKLEHRRSLIDHFVNAVVLHDDRIDFVFNYQKGTKTVAFKEWEEASEGSSDLIVSARPSKRSSWDLLRRKTPEITAFNRDFGCFLIFGKPVFRV